MLQSSRLILKTSRLSAFLFVLVSLLGLMLAGLEIPRASAASDASRTSLFSWGYNYLISGSYQSLSPAPLPAFSSEILSYAAGGGHNLVLLADGSVWAWGHNSNGQLGDGTTTDRSSPVRINVSNVVAVSGGFNHSLLLTADGRVWSSGWNAFGQLGDGTTTDRNTFSPVSSLSNVAQIEAGKETSTVILKDGTVWAWGANNFFEVGNGNQVNQSLPVKLSGLSNIVSVSHKGTFGLALDNAGLVYSWGYNAYGQGGIGTFDPFIPTPVRVTSLSNIRTIATGLAHSLAIKDDGTLLAWGSNDLTPSNVAGWGMLGDGTKISRNLPQPVPGLSKIVAVAGGEGHSVAVASNGSVYAWGLNNYGQLGDGTTTDHLSPVRLPGISGVSSIAASYWYNLALVRPAASFNPASINFGDQVINSKTTQTVTVTNTSSATLNIYGLNIQGVHASDFAPATALPLSVAPGASADLQVVFKPTATGMRNASLVVDSNAQTSTPVALSGNGIYTICNAQSIPNGFSSAMFTLQLCDANNNNLSNRKVTVTAVSVLTSDGNKLEPVPVNGYLNNNFVYVYGTPGFYRYELDISRYAPGDYKLFVQIAGDANSYAIPFSVVQCPNYCNY